MSYIGNSPGVASQRIVSPFTATAGQTLFTLSSGYSLGYLDVYLNGVKLINGTDYTANDGTTVTLTQATALNDTVECVAYLPRGLSDGYLKSEADARYARRDIDASINGITVGRGAGAVSTNTAVGASALAGSNSGTGLNTGLGYQALQSNTTGSYNTALGGDALFSNTTGSSNTIMGYQAGYSVTTANNNVFIGYRAGYSMTVFDGNNTFVGYRAGYASTNGIGANTYVGINSGADMTTGYYNSIFGRYGGNEDGLDIRTSSGYIVLSNGAGNIGARWQEGGGWYQRNNSASWSTTSDVRIKKNIAPITNGLEVVNALNPVEFDYITTDLHDEGFLAQEYEVVLPRQITHENNATDDIKALTNGEPLKGIQRNLDPYFVSAIKSLTEQVNQLKAELAAMKGN